MRAPRIPKDEAGGPPPAKPERIRRTGRNPEFEAALGARIRTTRIAARMSQTELGATVGISYQQVQKYENGVDRIAASTLQGLAAALGVHPGSFFNGEIPVPSGNIPEVRAAMRIAEAAQQVRDPLVIRRLLSFVEALAEAKHPTNDSDETT